MPRAADPALPETILDAAEALWRAGGDEAVTIRGVAAKAGTTTPTIYSYFEDRATLMVALRGRAQERFVAALSRSTDLHDCCERYLVFAERHPHDYELLYGYRWLDRMPPEVRDAEFAGFEATLQRAGVPAVDVRRVGLALSTLLHGAAMRRITQVKAGPWWRETRTACLEACDILARHAIGRQR